MNNNDNINNIGVGEEIDPVLIAATMQHRQTTSTALAMTMFKCLTTFIIALLIINYALPQILQTVETIARISH